MNTSGDVQYIGGISSVHRRDILSASEGYHEYIGGYHKYIGGSSVHPTDTMMHVGDIMSTSGDDQYIGVFNINQRLYSVCSDPT